MNSAWEIFCKGLKTRVILKTFLSVDGYLPPLKKKQFFKEKDQ
jgi:hypothetical protein